jgi:hypothetical protein
MSRGNPDLENSPNTSPTPLKLTNERLKFGGLGGGEGGEQIPVDEGHMVMRFLVVSQFTDTSKDMLSGTAKLLLLGRSRE